MNVQLLTITVSLAYDTLLLDGEYELQGKLVKVIPISARGPFTVTTNNAKVNRPLDCILVQGSFFPVAIGCFEA